jgi:hypothetical protein
MIRPRFEDLFSHRSDWGWRSYSPDDGASALASQAYATGPDFALSAPALIFDENLLRGGDSGATARFRAVSRRAISIGERLAL